MKNRTIIASKRNDFQTRFVSLSNDEMNNLRGGGQGDPPLPPTNGEDLPIDITALKLKIDTQKKIPTVTVPTDLPAAALANAAVTFIAG